MIQKQVSDQEFLKHFRLDTGATGFEYENVILHIPDTLSLMPKGYQIFYDFLYAGDTIGSFRADFDSSTRIIDNRNFHLLAFRKFIDKELTITKLKATDIALRNGMKRKDLEVILNCSADQFYWRCENDCDGCLFLDIDAKTGDIVGKGKVVYQY